MPCNTEYMEPTVAERQKRLAAQLLVFVYKKLDLVPIHPDLQRAADDIYGGGAMGEENVRTLCSVLRGMPDEKKDGIIYNGRDPMSRKLADWWDEHQREDWKRREAEAAKAKSFDTCLELAKQYMAGGYSHYDTAAKIAAVTGSYYDHDNSAHTFEFDDGVIILSGMDGLVAYKGKRV